MGTQSFLRAWGEQRIIRRGALVLCILIVIATACSYGNGIRLFRQAALDIARERAVAVLEKDVAMRMWTTASGGVFVPSTPSTPPNPYLAPAERERVTLDGQRLTRLNPAYLTRAVQAQWEQMGYVPTRITSLRPLRPENKADVWETDALLELARTGADEFSAVVEFDGRQAVRLMKPLQTEESCVSCHGAQGYRVGDVRGGLSVVVPVHDTEWAGTQRSLLISHGLFALFCLLLLLGGARKLLARDRERAAADAGLRELAATLEQRVAERTRAAEESEKRVRRILASTSDGLIGLDAEGKITFINQAALVMLGYADEAELNGRSLHESVHSRHYDGSPHSEEQCTLCEARRRAYRVKFQDEAFLRKDGSFVLISGSIAPVLEGARIAGSIVAFQDVSELREMAVLRQAMFDNSGEPFFFWDGQRRLKECNAAAVALVGAGSRRDLIEHVTDFRPEFQEDGEASQAKMAAGFERCDKEGAVSLRWTLRHADGTHIPCDVNVVRVTHRHFTGYFGSLHDLRALRESARELESGRKLLLDIIQDCPAAMIIHDRDLRIRLGNPAARRNFGLEEGAFLTSVWVRPDERERAAAEARSGVPVMRRPMQVYDRNGNQLDTLVSMSAVDYEGESGMLLWLQNVTELMAARREAEASAKAKSDFLAQMSHEIRNPMNAIMGMTHLLLETGLTTKQHHYVNRARQAARTLLGLLNDILDFSKIEAGRMSLECVPFRLSDVLRNFGDLLTFLAQEKGLELLVSVDADVPDFLEGDGLRLSQVLINLTNNALKFTEKGEVIVRCHLLKKSADEVRLQFEVSDSGIGLTPEQMERLFQPFRQGDETIARKYGGTGLGLAICDRLVKLMDGTLWVHSEEGKGSCFGFTVRLRPSASLPKAAKAERFTGERVLVVDTNQDARDILCAMTDELGCRVEGAASGEEALVAVESAVAAHDPYRVVLLAWKMAGMDGLACAAALRGKIGTGDMPALIMVSAFGAEEYRLHGRENGFQDYLAKPVLKADLKRALATALRSGALPAAGDGEEPVSGPEALADFLGARVLLVEDEELSREVATGMLESFGLEVLAVESGEEALRACAEQAFDLVLMDVQLPGMDGREATRRIRALPGRRAYEMPIVALTAYAMTTDRNKNLQAGMNDHIAKPVVPEALLEILRRWLRPRAGMGEGA